MGWQIALGRILGDKTDEGLDARTSYHMLFGMFGSMLWWPILATIITILAIAFNSNIDSSFGYDLVGMFGDAIWLELLAASINLDNFDIYFLDFSDFFLQWMGRSCRLFKVEAQIKNKFNCKGRPS